jgi:predicted ATPase
VIVADLDKANDPEIRLQALHCSWAANFHAGSRRECLHCVEEGLSLYEPDRAVISRVRYGGHDAKVCALGERAQLLWSMGEPEAARSDIKAALDWAETLHHVGSLCHALDNALLLARYEGAAELVSILARRAREIADAHGLPGVAAKSRIFSGWSRGMAGELAPGLRELEEGLAQQRAIGTDEDMPVYLDMRAELLSLAGEAPSALRLLDDAIGHAERSANLFWLPELYRRRAELRQQRGDDLALVRGDLDHALALATQSGATTLAQRARLDRDRFGAPLRP